MTKSQNALAAEPSPYLQQHASNPVDWFPWREDALKKAKEENRLAYEAEAIAKQEVKKATKEAKRQQAIARKQNEIANKEAYKAKKINEELRKKLEECK